MYFRNKQEKKIQINNCFVNIFMKMPEIPQKRYGYNLTKIYVKSAEECHFLYNLYVIISNVASMNTNIHSIKSEKFSVYNIYDN